jgi:site-specific DNA-cytosine methylase
MDDNIKKLHQALIDDGYDDVGTEQEFRDYVSDSKNVATLYNALSEAGYDNFKDQKSLETYLSAKAPVAQKPSTPQSSGQSVYSKEKKQTQYPQEVIDAFNSPDNKPGNFKDLAQLNDEYQRGELKKPGIISQALGMFSNVDAGNVGKEQKVGGMIANMLLGDNMQQPHDNNQQVQHLNQDNVPATEQTKPTAKDADAITSAAPVQQVDAIYNKYVGKGDALSETMYDLMASGQAKNQEEAQNMAMGAMNRAASRLAQRTTDEFVSKLGDTVEGVDEAVMNGWHSHAVQDNLKKLASQYGIMNNVAVDENGQYITQTNGYDQFINGMVKPAMVESLVKKYGENYRKTAEDLATRLYSNDEVIQNQLMNQDINAALVDVIGKYVNPSVVDEYNKAQEAGSKAFTEGMEGSQFIPANLRLGTALGAQYEANEAKDPAKVLSSLQKKFGRLYRNPEFLNDMSNAAFKVMQRYGLNGTQSSDPKQFKPMINSVLKNELDQLEIKGMMPKGSAEYIMKTGLGNTIVGKITRKAVQTDYQNWLEDIANQQYQPGFWENVASGALTFAGDAWSYWLPGAAGGKLTKSMVAKAEGKLAGDLMAKGMERRVAERAAKVLVGKSKAAALKSGAAHGAVTFGGQSAISKPIDEIYRTGQFDENGKIYNPSVGKVIANTLGEVAKQSAVGAIMQGGTIANMVGKGRGLATNILADIGGKVVDSGIMTGHQMLERMAQDPNFKPTGKDAAESFLESMANLTAIGLPGMMGKYARFKDAREFNKKFDFTDQDIAELKRFGYDGLRDAFERMGIGEYAVVGENAQRLDGQLTQKYMDMMNDKSVPEVLKAKMMAVVEGKRPSSFSPVIDSEVYRGDDGKYYLETYNKDGGVIDRKEYSSYDAARNDEKKLEYEKTLGLASVLEGEFHNEFTQEHLDGLYNKAAQKYNMGEKLTDEDKAAVYLYQNAGAIKEIMDKQQKGIILTDEEQKLVNAYRHYYDSALENSSVMREFVNTFEDSHDVAHGTLRKALESKDKKYAPLVESYLKELYNSIELKREMKQTMDDLYNTSHGNEQKRIEGESPVSPVEGSSESSAGGQEPPVSEGPAPYQDRTNSVPSPSDAEFAANPANVANSSAEVSSSESKVATSDAYVMGQNAYKNGDSEALQAINHNDDMAMARLVRAFADSEKMPDIVANAYNEGKDMELFVAQRSGSLTPAQKEAISKYVEAMDAKKGVSDAYLQEDAGYQENLVEQMKPYATEDGNIQMVELDSGKQVYLKKNGESEMVFIVAPDDQGNPVVKTISKSKIVDMGKPIPFDTFINQEVQRHEQQRNSEFLSQFGKDKLTVGEKADLAINLNDTPLKAEIVSINNDGTVSFVLGNSSRVQQVPREDFLKMRNFANTIGINAELDAEDAQRAEKEAIKAEAEKKQRFADGIVGLSEQKPDYSSKETDPKVAAEYLQEQYADNHGQLIKLVNGSRSDIKEQIDNIRKRIVEAEDWLDTNADLEPEQAQSREDKLKLAKEQLEDLTTRYDNWNKIRSLIMTEEEKRELKDERTANIKKVGIDKEALTVTDEREVPVLTDEELKKQYPAMDEASDYILSQRKEISKTQEELHRQLEDIDARLNQYLRGEADLTDEEIRDFNTTKADLEARQANLTESAKDLKAQADKLKTLYRKENMEARAKAVEDMTPAEQRAIKVENAIKNGNMNQLNSIYEDVRGATDFNDTEPNTLEEYVANNIGRFTLNYEGKEKGGAFSNGIQQETGLGRKDFEKLQILAKEGEGKTVPEFVHSLYDDMPMNLKQMGYTDHDIRSAFLDLIGSAQSYSDIKNYTLNNKVANVEQLMRDVERQEEEMKENGTHSEAFDKIVELAKEQKEYWDLMEQGEVDPDDVPEVDVAYDMDELLKTLSDEEFKVVSDVLKGIDEEFEYFTADEYERREGTVERKKKVENANAYEESIKQALKPVTPFAYALKSAVESGDKKAVKKAQKELTDALIASDLGHDYLSGQLAQAKLAKKKDELYKVKRATIKPLTDAIRAIESDENIENASFADRLKNAIAETEAEPTEAQKKAGNYKKGHLTFGGYDFTVETPKGVTRSGKDEQGKPWSVTMHDTYGYILGKIGVDGDHIDMFINDAADLDTFDGNVYVVDQVNMETGEFDEHKVMYGYPSEEAATEAYLANYSKGWKGLGKVTSVPKATFDKWLESSDRKTKPFADYAMIKKDSDVLSSGQKDENLPFAQMNMDDLPFHRDVKEVKTSEMTEAQKVAYDAVSTMLKKAGIPVKVVSNEDMEKVADAQDNLNLAMLLNQPEMRFKIKTPEEKQAAENAYNFAKDLRPNKWAQYAVVDMSNPNKMPEFYQKQELARKERTYLNRLMWGNYKVFNLDKSFEDNVAGLTGSFPSEFDPYKIDEQTSKKNELKKQIKETEEAYKSTGQERKEYQNQLMKEYMDEHGLASENDIPDDVWREFDYKAIEKYQDKLDSLFAKYKDLDRQLKAIVQPGVQYLKGKGVVYGYTDGKEIVLNQEHLNPNTPIHEYQHLWRTAAKEMNPELIAHGDELIKQTQLFRDLKEDPNYKHLSDDEICDEAFARLTGEDGAAILEQMAKDAIKENPLDTAKELTIINRLKNWLKKFWYWTLDTFTKWKPEDIKKMTLEDIRNLVLRDLANGVDPRNVKSRMTKEDAVSLRKQMEDNAEQERILEHTEENWQKEFGKDSRVTTPIGSIKLGENQYKKAGRNDRIKRFGLLKPTLERPDVILEKSAPKEGAERQTKYLFIKSFKKADGNKILNYESITVKQGEEEVAISAHQIEPSKVVKELTESRVLWNRFRGDSNSLGENQGSALTPSANNPSGKDSVLNPHSDAKIRNNIETAKGNGGNLSVEDKIKAVSQQFGVDEADVAMYANAVKKGSTAEAARARANIKRYLLQANEDKISSFKDIIKYTKPVNEALKENFGDLDAMIEERVKQVEAQRNAMEAARKRAEEEEAKRQKHLEELSVIPDDQLDKQYMDALAKGDDATAREMLDEAARRKGYDDTESAYQGVGAWAAPGNPGYESDKARRDDWESSGSDVNLEDIALGYAPQPDDYFSHPERYSQNTPHGLESVKAINTAIDAIKNGEKDVKVKVYRAVPTSVKEGKLRNGDWVTPSKKYAEMHGTNRLDGKYRIIEDEVPANQLWWDGNDANEFGFDDGKAYKYKNAKNNRKLNDLVTYDDEGDVIPPSKRFNSRKSDIRFMFAGEKGAAEADKAEEKTYRMDNLKVAEKMERGKKDAKAIKLATGWERGADGKWRYEMPDAKIKDMKDIGGGNIVKRFDDDMLWNDGKLADVIDAPGLFEAYPQLKDVRIDTDAIMNDMPSNGEYNPKTNTITIHADELKYMNSILNHEIQHAIQFIEGFATGGNEDSVRMRIENRMQNIEDAANVAAGTLEEYRNISTRLVRLELARKWKKNPNSFLKSSAMFSAPGYGPFTPKKEAIEIGQQLADTWIDDAKRFVDSRSERLLAGEDKMDEAKVLAKWKNEWHNKYVDWKDFKEEFDQLDKAIKDLSDYQLYHALAGEVESRNVQNRLGMTDEERRNSLAEETEDVNRDEQIVMNVGDTSYSIVKDPETIKKLDKEDTVKVYRAMQVGEDGKLYPPMAAKVKGKFVEPIELGKWEQADERPELADDKGMFTLNKGNGKSLKAAYNPYLHTSRTPLNDQFSEAQNRPNIVTVEVEVPKSELISGYKADKAKDAVGEVEWKAGIIQGQLTGKRKVVLSRWDKPVRIVPDSEVADVIVNDMFKGKNITMPSNVVTPSLRKELEKRGVPFVETDNRGRIVGGENDGVHYSKVYGKNAQSPIMEQKLQKHPNSLMKAGTYFSGGGLVEEGLKGIIDPVVAVEYDRKISGVYRNNFGQHIVTADVRDVDPKELVKQIDGEVEYFHASPVCKNYSQAKTNGGEVELDKETAKSTADFINAVKPRVVTIENVKGYKDSEAMKIITKALDKNGYTWDADVYNAADFGGYTNRERLIVRAVKDGELPEKPKKQPRKGGWLEAVEDILPTLTVKESGVAPWMDARLKADGIDWQKVEKLLYVMGSAYADGKIPHAYGDEILPTLRTKSGDVIIMPGGKVLRADGRVLARITGLGDDYLLPKTESLSHTIIGNGIPVQLTQGVIAPLLNKDNLSGRNVLARLGKSIFKNDWDVDKQKKVSDQVVNTANKLGGAEATVYTSVDEVPDAYLSDVKNGATGWYDPTTHTVHVYLPNCADANEAERTVLHEKIGHEGMEVLLGGEDEVRKFANFVYNSVAASTRGKILEIANEYDPDWKKHDRMNVGTQEYIARLAEEGPKTAEDFSLWTKIKHYLIKVLKKLGIRVPGLLNDKDLRYYLMKAGKALHVWDEMPQEKQETMMKQASNAEIKDSLGEGADLPSEGDNKLKKKTERGRIDEATGAFKLAPNGEQSNLSKKQYIEARTKNFKVWFGGDWEKKPKDFKNKLDANGEPLEKYVEGYLNRPKKPTMPKKRKGEDEATFFERKILYSHALEDWPKTEADWKKRIDEFDENTLAALTPPDEEAIREKYQKQYENDMASWRKDHPYIKEGEERPLQIPDMRDYQSIQDYGEALRKHEIWKTAPHKDEYDRMAEDEIISKVALMDAVQHPFSEYARLKAMKAEFQHMRHVMQNQKVYDQNTTDAVVQFAKRFMSLGYGDDLGRGSINTLLTIVKNSTGRKSHEIPQQLYQVMDVLMNNQLRNFDRAVMKTMSIKELKENAKGIQVQGKLELRGQTTIKAFRDAVSSRIPSDKLDEKISNLIDKMTDDRKNASSYQDELLGLNLAKQYVDYIDSSRNDAIEIEDLKKLEIENYKGRKGIYKGELTKALLQEHVERLNQYDEALFNNKVERMDRYSQLLANLGGMIDESVKGAREFQERDARRAINVKMMASADLGDKSMNQHHKENWKTRLSNSDVARLFCSPLGSFDALMREFGSKQINGEGQLWNHFVRGAMKASNDEFKSVREANNEIDLKVSELFGKVTEDKNGNKKGNMILNDLYALERSNKVKSLDVTIRDIEGEQTYKLQQGNLMYIYMVNKMPDGAMKLREMGILDADVERIKENIDPRFLKLADWIQGEFLPKMRTKYNKRHEELFGAPMPMVENYFPLRVLKNARYMEEDVNNTSDGSNALPSTATGAIIKRKTNKLPLDILNSDALSVTIDNIKEMENWYNYAPIRKDANTLLSDTTFRNRVQNMTTIYGSGERLWNNVKDATAVAMGTYRPKGGTDLAVSLKNFGKGITGAKISGRLYTAFKQVLSAPLFLPDVDLGRFVRHSVHPYGSFKWAIENLPNFDKRWSGRKLGDTVLMDDPTDWKLWHTNLMEKAAYYGMTPNALVDAVTCAVGARAVYDTKYKQYIKYGLTEERAKEKALSDAEINFNTSQQSSEGAFVSPMQLDRTLESAIFTPFRNSSMLYERKGINALRNLKHRFEKGHKEASIKFMAGQLMEEGVGYEQATKAAEKMYQKGLMHNIANAIVALWLGPIIWNLGGNFGYLMFGDDNEKKKKMVLDAVILGLLEGPVDGLAGGQFINTAIANTITSDGISLKGLKNVDFSGMPMLSDFNSMIEKFGYDKVAGAQDLMFMVMQSSTGFNPKTLTDAINACIDYGNGDMTNAKEIALFVFRLMNGPAATVDNLYIDELGMKGKDAKKLSYEELAKRYAEYKFGKNTFGLGKLYSDEEKQKKLKAIEKSFDKKVSERLAGMDREDLKNEFSESRSQKEKKLIGKIIADELETKDSEAVKKAKADASYLRQRNFSDLMDDLYLQQEWESTKTAQDGLDELKGNGATDEEIKSYKLHHKPELDKRKTIEAARKAMGKEKKNLTSDNDTQVMAKIRAERDKVLIPLRKQKSEK